MLFLSAMVILNGMATGAMATGLVLLVSDKKRIGIIMLAVGALGFAATISGFPF